MVVARGTASCPEGAVVSETPGGMRLTTHSCDAVPGLSAQEQRTALDFVPDTVSRRTAHRALHGSGRRGRRHREVVDQVAAVMILQQALDLERSSGAPAGEQVGSVTHDQEGEG